VILVLPQEFVALYGPLVILLEDLQHFDSASCRLLTALVAALPTGLLLVATHRSGGGGGGSVHYDGSSVHYGGGPGGFPKILQVRFGQRLAACCRYARATEQK